MDNQLSVLWEQQQPVLDDSRVQLPKCQRNEKTYGVLVDFERYMLNEKRDLYIYQESREKEKNEAES